MPADALATPDDRQVALGCVIDVSLCADSWAWPMWKVGLCKNAMGVLDARLQQGWVVDVKCDMYSGCQIAVGIIDTPVIYGEGGRVSSDER